MRYNEDFLYCFLVKSEGSTLDVQFTNLIMGNLFTLFIPHYHIMQIGAVTLSTFYVKFKYINIWKVL